MVKTFVLQCSVYYDELLVDLNDDLCKELATKEDSLALSEKIAMSEANQIGYWQRSILPLACALCMWRVNEDMNLEKWKVSETKWICKRESMNDSIACDMNLYIN